MTRWSLHHSIWKQLNSLPMALVPILLLTDFIRQAKLLNIKFDCLVNCSKDFTKEWNLFSLENQKGRKKERKKQKRKEETNLQRFFFFFFFQFPRITTKNLILGFSWWLSRLRVWSCHRCGSSCCCGASATPGLRTFMCHGLSRKYPTKNKTKNPKCDLKH